ncbi:MAG: hypothetical protein IJW79_11725 [Clostridia bacterium]|nr:hypothetical protein [Clostridia bacterium]
MSNFLAKYKNGETQEFKIAPKSLDNGVLEYEFTPNMNYSKVNYVEFPLHDFPINAGDDGFFLLPSGNKGCKNREYALGIFKEREDEQAVLKNCFTSVYGFRHFELLRTAIVTGMEHDVQFVITVKDNQYSFSLRFVFDGEVPYENAKLEIHDVKNAEATYCDMAKIYREYKLKNGFRPIKARLTPELEYSAQAPNIRIRMGWKPVPCQVIHQTPETEPPLHSACTFDDVTALMEEYKALGVEKAEICLVGWNSKGHDGRWPQVLPLDEEFGGEEALRRAIKRAEELGYIITNHTNITDNYTVADCYDESLITVKKDGNLEVEATRWAGGRTYNMCPEHAWKTFHRMHDPVKELGFHGTQYIDVMTCIPARCCYHSEHPVNKKECAEYYDKIFGEAQSMFGAVGSEGAYDHSLKNCDFTLYVSFLDYLHADDETRPTLKRHPFCEKYVPFWQLVYHGIVLSNPYSRTINALLSNEKDDILKVIEYGGKPQMYYYGHFVSDGSDWLGKVDLHCHTEEERNESARIVKDTLDIWNEMSYLQFEFMEKHEEISDGVFAVTYSDGSVVTVDYNKKTYSLKKAN